MTSETFTTLARALQITREADGWLADVPVDWSQGRATFGGLVAGLGIRVLQAELAEPRVLRSFVMSFAGPVEPGPVSIRSETLRVGRSLTHVQARFEQKGRTPAVMVAAFGAGRESTVQFAGDPQEPADAALDVARVGYVAGLMPVFVQHFDFRITSRDAPFSGAARGRLSGWVRAIDADILDSAVLAAITDSWAPPTLPMMKAPAPNSTVTWMANFPSVKSPPTLDEFLRYEADTLAAADGYATTDAKLWSAAGELIAISRQLVSVFG